MGYSTLTQHKRVNGVLKTPMNLIPFMTPMEKNETWTYGRMPEYIWLSLILDYYGSEEGFRKVAAINKQIHTIAHELSLPQLSQILKLPSDKQDKIYYSIKTITKQDILTPLTLFLTIDNAPRFANAFYINNESIDSRYSKLKNIIDKTSSQSSDITNHTRYCVLCFIASDGRLHVRKQQAEEYSKYQFLSTNTEEYKKISSSIRATEGLLIKMNDTLDEQYLNNFWECVSKMTYCNLAVLDFSENRSLKDFNSKVYNILVYLKDLYQSVFPLNKKLEIYLGMLTYSYKRLKEIDEHNLYTTIAGRSEIRSLIENFIVSKYLITFEKDKPQIWDDFEKYGIGGIKKIVLFEREHQNERREKSHISYEYLDFLLNEYKMEEFTDIDLRYFDNSRIDKKAEDVDEKEIVSLYYNYDTQYEHGLWGAIRESSMLKCDNSTHQYHLIPDIEDEQKLKSIYSDCIFVMKKMISFYATQIEIPESLVKEVSEYND